MTAPAAPAAAPKGRLGNGQLRRQVAEYLADNPGPCKTGDIAKALGRSAGAVGNALTTLAGNGEADLVPGKPIRYQANSATATAAAAIALRAPLPPRAAPAPVPAPTPAPAAPVPSPAPTPAAAGPVTRPNGQLYQPRALADMPDVEALRKLREAGVPALLYGPPGTGKTSLIEAAFPDLITVAGDGDTTAALVVRKPVDSCRWRPRGLEPSRAPRCRRADLVGCYAGGLLFRGGAFLAAATAGAGQSCLHHTRYAASVTNVSFLSWANTGIERDLAAGTPREDVGLAELGLGVGEDFPGGAGGQRAEVFLLAYGAAGGGDGLRAAVGVAGGPGQDELDVGLGVVVGEDGLLEVAGRAVRDQKPGSGGDGVGRVHDVPAVAVQRPGRRLELHRAEGAGAGRPVVLAVAAFHLPDGGQDGPRDAVLGSGCSEVGEVVRRNGGRGAERDGIGIGDSGCAPDASARGIDHWSSGSGAASVVRDGPVPGRLPPYPAPGGPFLTRPDCWVRAREQPRSNHGNKTDTTKMTWGYKTPDQNGCAARDLNPEPAD
jgi:hypothetical protein